MNARDRILAAAVDDLNHFGLTGLRLQRVALMAQVSAPLINQLFGGRQGLVVAASAERSRIVIAQLAELVPDVVNDEMTDEQLFKSLRSLLEESLDPGRRLDRYNLLESIAISRHDAELSEAIGVAVLAANDRLLAFGEAFAGRGLLTEGISAAGFARFVYSILFGEVMCEFDDRLLVSNAEWMAILMHSSQGVVQGSLGA